MFKTVTFLIYLLGAAANIVLCSITPLHSPFQMTLYGVIGCAMGWGIGESLAAISGAHDGR